MTLFECIYAFLSADATLAAKLPGGVVPAYIPQDGTFPLCVVRYYGSVSQRPTHDNGPSPWSLFRLEFTFWGGDFATMEQCAARVDTLFSVPNALALGSSGRGIFCPQQTNGPRTVREPERRIDGVQIDVLGLLNSDTIA